MDAQDSTSQRVRWQAKTIGWACERMKKSVVGGRSEPEPGGGDPAAAAVIPALLLMLLLLPREGVFCPPPGVVELLADGSPAASANAARAMPRTAAIVRELPARAATACTCA